MKFVHISSIIAKLAVAAPGVAAGSTNQDYSANTGSVDESVISGHQAVVAHQSIRRRLALTVTDDFEPGQSGTCADSTSNGYKYYSKTTGGVVYVDEDSCLAWCDDAITANFVGFDVNPGVECRCLFEGSLPPTTNYAGGVDGDDQSPSGTGDVTQVMTGSAGGGFFCYEWMHYNSEAPSSQPSEQPSSQPSSQPSEQPSSQPSESPSEQPSSQPSESPSEQPSSQPSESPSSQPSESPSDRPSSQPSESPSDMPSSSPSSQPSSEPSESPSSMPSSEPSETPSCTPSSAPTPSPSINLFYPDQTSNGFETGCLNDGAQPAWMENNPTNWLFSSLQRCCETHFSWNLQYCTGSIDDTCARAYWYPNWEGNGDGCVRDGDEPFYMLQHSGHYLFSTKADCCDEHYSWDYSTCMGGAGGSSSGSSYYADWTSGDETCKNDGAAPEYMVSNTQWLHDTREACCARHFSYKKGECMGTSTSTTGTGKYFPDWAGDNSGCLVDGGSNVAPDYMHSSSSWLFDSLEACCDQHYSWNKNGCMGSGGTSTVTGSMKWYVNWSDHKCYKDCETATDCGGLAENWDILHDSQSDCCSAHVGYDTKSCKDI